jgi:hypothetical protein
MSHCDPNLTPGFDFGEPLVFSHNCEEEDQNPHGHPMSIRHCIFVIGLFVLAVVFSYFVVFRIDPFAAGLYRATSHAMAFAEVSQGESR